VEEEEARVEDGIPENFDQDMMGWTDEDLDELQQMARLEDAQDSMSFITALRKASLDDAYSKLPPDALDRLRNPPRQLLDISDPDLILSLKYYLPIQQSLLTISSARPRSNDTLKMMYTVITRLSKLSVSLVVWSRSLMTCVQTHVLHSQVCTLSSIVALDVEKIDGTPKAHLRRR
jgi:hypothetical protein